MLIPRTLIFVTRGESVLLLKGAPDKRLWANRYNGVGGHVERGESILAAARRELLEETGLRADLRLRGTLLVDADDAIGIGLYIFQGENPKGELRASREGTLEWIPFDALTSYPLVEDVAEILNRLLAMRRDDPPFSARSFYDETDTLRVCFES